MSAMAISNAIINYSQYKLYLTNIQQVLVAEKIHRIFPVFSDTKDFSVPKNARFIKL